MLPYNWGNIKKLYAMLLFPLVLNQENVINVTPVLNPSQRSDSLALVRAIAGIILKGWELLLNRSV